MRKGTLRLAEDPVQLEASRTVEANREIDLSEAEVLAANLLALGVPTEGAGQSPEERVYEALVRLMRERKSYVASRAVADVVGLSPNTITNILSRLEAKGRVIHTINPSTGKPCFVPKVV